MALRREQLAVLLALVTAVCMGSALFFSKGNQLLMPGPLTSGHAAIENCTSCHTTSGGSKLSWLHGLVAADPLADSRACLTCHKMPDTAFNAHGASAAVLEQSTRRLTKIAAGTTPPRSAMAQSVAFPMQEVIAGGLYCATCHQEHQGANFTLNKISNAQCGSCHVVKFDSFDGQHPKFVNFPFERRTRIIFDHAGHFAKHYPEVAKKDPAKRIPSTCAACHNSGSDRRVMATAPFDQTCTACHLGQIIGKERVSGPKGIAFLALPGLDLATLQKKNALIGEWPDAADAALTPFMKVMISRSEQGRALLKTVAGLNLQDLGQASDAQIKAVADLAWEIKGLFHALVKGKASDVLGNLTVGGATKLDAARIADLTAGLPRDAVIGAQQEWLPNLAAEIASGPVGPAAEPVASNVVQAVPIPSPEEPPGGATADTTVDTEPADAEPAAAESAAAGEIVCADEPPRAADIAAADDVATDADAAELEAGDEAETLTAEEQLAAVKGRLPLPNGTPRAIKTRTESAEKKNRPEEAEARIDDGTAPPCAGEPPSAETGAGAVADAATAEPQAGSGSEAPASGEPPSGQAEQFDDLLFPTGAENAGQSEQVDDASKAEATAPPEASPDADTTAAAPQAAAAPATGIDSDVEPETWAEYGGWYRQDYAILYRPAGHKDKFIQSWLVLTGPQAPKGGASAAAAVFDFLTGKDAPGSCTKCHSVDDVRGKGRVVNFAPLSLKSKLGRFTNFVHEPHMGIPDKRGCLACHALEKGSPYLKSYEQDNPWKFASGFGAVKKELCQTCHTSGEARQDCLLCHTYHVNGAATPIMNTGLPAQ